jgi:TolB-like protein/Tfp pilus assembly protein PilF
MKADRAALLDVIESVADGADLDWDALEAGLKDEQDRRLFAQLKILARIAEVHRSQSDEPEDHVVPSRTLGAKVIGQILPQRAPNGPADTQRVDEGAPVFEAPAIPVLGPTMGLPDAALPEFPPVDVVRPGSLLPDERPSRIWGHLELLARIGEGTFGEVYRARDTKLQREVAVKLLRVGGGPEDRQTETVLREARILARVTHPNVVLVHGAETVDGRVGLWMELIRGATLEQLIQSHGPYSAREATVIGQDLCRALAAVHGAGLVHRDVKAQNVMREEGGRLVLMDFGAGQMLGGPSPGLTGRITGTPLYLAPEVLAGGEATTRSDIYSLGVLLYHLVTASYPLRARSVEELREAHRAGKRIRLHDARPDLQDNLVEVIERALAPEPRDRFSSSGEMQSALTLALGVGVAGGNVPTREIQPLIGAPRTPSRAGATGARPGWMLVAAVCAFALVGGAMAAWFVKSSGWSPFAAAPASLTRQTIAVLPIQSASGTVDPVFVEVQDSLISALGRISSLRAISRTSVMRYASGGKLMPEIGRELNAEYVIESTASREGDRLRMTSRLVRAGDDTQLWATTIERPLTEVLKMGGLALDIAGILNSTVGLDERKGLVAEHTPESAAQTAYLEGRYQLARDNADGYRAARALFERAVSLDPQYARAYASLAHCYLLLHVHGVLPRDEAGQLLTDAARRAVAADGSLSSAHAQLATALFSFGFDWKGAGEEFRRAIALNASDTEARSAYARFLASRGELAEAIRQIELAREAAPMSADVLGSEGIIRYYARDLDKAEAAFRRALEGAHQTGKLLGLGRVLAAKGDCAGAISTLEQAVQASLGAPQTRAELARTYASCGQAAEARRILSELEQPPASALARVSPHHRAYVYAALGDKDRAFALLDEAMAQKQPDIEWAKVDPRLDSLRGDSRYSTFLRGLGLGE